MPSNFPAVETMSREILPSKMSATKNVTGIVGLALSLLCLNFLHTYWRLRHIPGPFWAKFTNLPRIWWVKSGSAQEIHLELHKKYGNIVRFGPNMVSISDPAAIPTVYPVRPGIPKVQSSSIKKGIVTNESVQSG